MTLIFGSLTGLICGLVVGQRRRVAYAVTALVWYASLATQTAHLAQPGVAGFFGVDGPSAVQGRWLGQYWLAQPLILALNLALVHVGRSLRQRFVGRRSVPAAS